MTNQQRVELIKKHLQNLAPTFLDVQDESHLHIGHAGAQSGAGHFCVTIASPRFQNQSRVTCHRLVYDAVNSMLGEHIHALRIIINS